MSGVISTISPQKRKALYALSKFRFLITPQLLRLGLSKNDKSLREKTLTPLANRKLIEIKRFGMGLPNIHCPTEKGAQLLSDIYGQPIDDFPYPKGKVQFADNRLAHRQAQVDFHIGLQLWTDQNEDIELVLAEQDLMVTGSRRYKNFTPITEIKIPGSGIPIIPDGVFRIELASGSRQLYVVEVHKTTQTKAVANQLRRYLETFEDGLISDKYGYETAPIICSLHERQNVLSGAKREFRNLPFFEELKSVFLFNTFEQLELGFSKGWHYADDQPANPFPSS